jgi:phage terminase small subunit
LNCLKNIGQKGIGASRKMLGFAISALLIIAVINTAHKRTDFAASVGGCSKHRTAKATVDTNARIIRKREKRTATYIKLMAKDKQKPLTKRQKAFVEAMADPTVKSATEAAKRAGYSEKGAKVKASQMVTSGNFSEYIEQRKKEIAEYSGITPEFVIGGVTQLALDAEENTVKLGAYKTLGNYIGLDKAPLEKPDERLESIKRTVQAKADDKGVSYEEELRNYLENYAAPEFKEKLASELIN